MLYFLMSTTRWTGDLDLVRELEYEARAALNWIDAYADLQGNGYVSYQRRNEETGLENQCWKDSWDSIAYPTAGCRVSRATCELQGYAYDAKMRAARLARLAGRFGVRRPAGAAGRRPEAPVQPGLLGGGRQSSSRLRWTRTAGQVDSLTSNNGHLLWSGIVDDEKAEIVVRHLLGERLFSGWGFAPWR